MAVKKKMKHECGNCADGGCGEKTFQHGIQVTYDPQTGICTEANYDMGNLHGEYTEYYDMDSGLIRTRGRYETGLKEGEWITYGTDGAMETIEVFSKGKKKKKK
ncbi:MAG: hypothetical protein LLG37_05410 [Spirochaetia bacterium]|nr:hypothetical protein [Spirochaetia bacterium]